MSSVRYRRPTAALHHYFALPLLLAACGNDLNCSSKETRQLVDQIVQGEAKKGGITGPNSATVTVALDDIITTDKQKAKTACKATLRMTILGPTAPEKAQTVDLNVTYNVEKTDDGRLYVTVFGL